MTPLFVAAPFLIAEDGHQFEGPAIGDWLDKPGYIRTMEKGGADRDPQDRRLVLKSQTQKSICNSTTFCERRGKNLKIYKYIIYIYISSFACIYKLQLVKSRDKAWMEWEEDFSVFTFLYGCKVWEYRINTSSIFLKKWKHCISCLSQDSEE